MCGPHPGCIDGSWLMMSTEIVTTIQENVKLIVILIDNHGFSSIGCEPCTRPTRKDQPERDGLWWWENSRPDPEVDPAGDGI